MVYTVRRTDDEELVWWLNSDLFKKTDFEGSDKGNAFWVVREEPSHIAVGFCSARPVSDTDVLLSRCGVLPEARGHGLQRRMISVRCRWARTVGLENAITYCHPENIESAHNIQRSGFSLYVPSCRWVGPEYQYWIKEL